MFTAKRWVTKHVVEEIRKIPSLANDVESLKTDVAEIRAEVKPNGGSSMRDSTNRSEALATSIAEKVGVPIPDPQS